MGRRGPQPSGCAQTGAQRQAAHKARRAIGLASLDPDRCVVSHPDGSTSLLGDWVDRPKPTYISRTVCVRDDQHAAISALADVQERPWSQVLRDVIAAGLRAMGECA
jgi:hypothetical protein